MEIKKASKYMLSEKEEVLISKMRNTGSRPGPIYKTRLFPTSW